MDPSLHTTEEILKRSRKKRERKGGERMEQGRKTEGLEEIRKHKNIFTFIHSWREKGGGDGRSWSENRTVQGRKIP